MKISRRVVQEIAHRFVNFVLAVIGVSIAVACLVASVTMIDAGEIQSRKLVAEGKTESERLVAKREQEVKDAGKKLNDEMRKITKGLGFNIVVLAADAKGNKLNTARWEREQREDGVRARYVAR